MVRGDSDVDLRCGGHPMTPVGETVELRDPEPGFADGSLLGKRYCADDLGIELLCIKSGSGSLSVGGEALHLKQAKPLPSSD